MKGQFDEKCNVKIEAVNDMLDEYDSMLDDFMTEEVGKPLKYPYPQTTRFSRRWKKIFHCVY